MSGPITYLDHAATTAAAARGGRGDGVGPRAPARQPDREPPAARSAPARLLEDARDEVAAFLGRDPGEIVFTSGGTEAANLAVLGTAEAAFRQRGEAVVLASAVEHPAVRESAKAALQMGIDVLELPVDGAGRLDRDALDRTLTSRCTVVAVMTANNETGVVQPLAEVVESVRRRAPAAYVFTDAVQAAPYLDLADVTAGVDMVGLSAHKFGGPVGTGALAVSSRVTLSPRIYGGGQERERRSGTPDVAGAVGMATALQLVDQGTCGGEHPRPGVAGPTRRRDCSPPCPGPIARCRPASRCCPGICISACRGSTGRSCLWRSASEGICVSGGSSCASGALEPSHVLAAMGVDREFGRRGRAVLPGLRHDRRGRRPCPRLVPGVAASLRRAV